ncbi:P-loop containing nucleoside triphosphate hydrolase protein, partial [Athelia psychrophila]
NIILFGESGAGKSSLVDMIAGMDCAKTSDGAVGCTFQSTSYDVDLPDHSLIIWDTAGLNEGQKGNINFTEAAGNIYKLTYQLDGVNLLVYCVRSRITNNMVQNYNMFRAFCDDEVPIVLVITAMENCPDGDVWWASNIHHFEKEGIEVVDHACVSTLKGYGEGKYEAWRAEVQDMIAKHYLRTPWVMAKESWFVWAVT